MNFERIKSYELYHIVRNVFVNYTIILTESTTLSGFLTLVSCNCFSFLFRGSRYFICLFRSCYAESGNGHKKKSLFHSFLFSGIARISYRGGRGDSRKRRGDSCYVIVKNYLLFQSFIHGSSGLFNISSKVVSAQRVFFI